MEPGMNGTAEPAITQVPVKRWCNHCFWEWVAMLGREELRRILDKQTVGECPNCHKPTRLPSHSRLLSRKCLSSWVDSSCVLTARKGVI